MRIRIERRTKGVRCRPSRGEHNDGGQEEARGEGCSHLTSVLRLHQRRNFRAQSCAAFGWAIHLLFKTEPRHQSHQIGMRHREIEHARRIVQDTSRLPQGDPAKMAKIMIDSVDQNPAPKRIALGSDAYTMIHKALTDRLAALEAQKDLAFSTDLPASAYRGAAASRQATAVPQSRSSS